MSRVKDAWWDEITSEDYSPDWGFASNIDTYTTNIYDDQFTLDFDTPKKLGIDVQKQVDSMLEDANIKLYDDGIPF
jgi:hypothetical protein